MDTPWTYEVRVEGHLPERWSEWFDGLLIQHDPGGDTILRGVVTDQAALFGVLTRIHALNLALISVDRFPSTTASNVA